MSIPLLVLLEGIFVLTIETKTQLLALLRKEASMKRLLIFAGVLLLAGCSWGEPELEQLSFLSWNVHNLFDDVADGNEPAEFDPKRGTWNRTLFLERLERTAKVLRSVEGGSPHVVALQEIENLNVVHTLNERFLAFEGYQVVGVDQPELRIIPVMLTKIRPTHVGLVQFPDFKGEPQRPALEMMFEWEGRRFIVWNNHWKSQRDGEQTTRLARLKAGELLTERAQWLRERYPEAVMVALGDFNSELSEGAFLTQWYRVPSNHGTYFFQGRWTALDHALIFLPFKERADLSVLALPFLLTESGSPRGYSTRDRGGYSDHLPILLRLVIQESLGYTRNDGMEKFSRVPELAQGAVALTLRY